MNSDAVGSPSQASETKLMTRNQELAEEISSLSSQLEKSKGMVEELHAEQQHLLDQLQASESLLSKTVNQHKEVAERDLQLESELAESRHQIDKLTMKNNELLEMTNSLSSKLAACEKTIRRTPTNTESPTLYQNPRINSCARRTKTFKRK